VGELPLATLDSDADARATHGKDNGDWDRTSEPDEVDHPPGDAVRRAGHA
jgi:hypothetical protein